MNRRTLTIVGVVALALLLALATWRSLTAGIAPGTLVLAGDVRSDVRVVRAPAIQYPVPDFKVGIPVSSTTGGPSSGSRGGSAQRSTQPTISGMLEAVYVRQGDRVKAGQQIAQLDTTMLELGVKQAKTDAAKSRADIAVLGKKLDTVASGQDKLATARGQLATAAQLLATAGKALAAGKALLLTDRGAIAAGIKQLEGVINGPHPPGPWPPADAVAQLNQLKAALAGIDAALAGLPVAEGQLAQGEAQLATGKAQIASGASALAKAKKQLKKARAVTTEVAKGKDVLVNLAEYRVSEAVVRSPVDGVVTEARNAGTVAMVNAPLVRVRPDGPTEVETYLTGNQLETVSVGTWATVDFDSNTSGPLTGRVTLVNNTAEFPPTSFPTNIVHMTQTVKVRIRLDDGGWAPPGTPVDVRIKTDSGR